MSKAKKDKLLVEIKDGNATLKMTKIKIKNCSSWEKKTHLDFTQDERSKDTTRTTSTAQDSDMITMDQRVSVTFH